MSPLLLPRLLLPGEFSIELPYSKSVAARRLLLAYLHHKPLPKLSAQGVALSLYSQDIIVLHQALTKLATRPPHKVITLHCGESGTAMRFLMMLALFEPAPTHLVGDLRLLERIATDDISFIRQMGGDYLLIPTQGVTIYPPKQLLPSHLTAIWGSSQYLSALELCMSVHKVPINYQFPKSSPSYSYLQLTRSMLQNQETTQLERDWSAASFWYQLLATQPTVEQITLRGLSITSSQPDAKLPDIFSSLGVKTYATDSGIQIRKSQLPKAETLTIDLSQNIDLFLPIALTAIALCIPFCFSGIDTLRYKESDRISSFLKNISPYGYSQFTIQNNRISWSGELPHPPHPQVTIHPHQDHRVAMAFTVFALTRRHTTTTLLSPEVVAKSYPTFLQTLLSLSHPG